jgi:hypothetical protein
MPPPRAIAALVVAMLAVTVGGCRGPRGRAAALRPPEVLVEVLPRSARVELDGRAIGAGGGAVASPGADEHVLRVSADGYEPEERVFPAGSLEGARIAAALRPRGSGIARAIDYDDGPSLAAAAEWLAASGDPRDAASTRARDRRGSRHRPRAPLARRRAAARAIRKAPSRPGRIPAPCAGRGGRSGGGAP